MPVTLPLLYPTFRLRLESGTLDLSSTRCPADCGDLRPLRLTSRRRSRTLYTVEPVTPGGGARDELVRIPCVVPLATCRGCGAMCRVLPADVHARKLYSLTAIEHFAARYVEGDVGLRKAVNTLLGDDAPSHTTLHAWTEGLGACALGQPAGAVAGTTPAQAVTSRLAERQLIGEIEPAPVALARRARSDGRRERLVAGFALLAVVREAARRVGGAITGGVATINALILGNGVRAPMGWRTGLT